MFIRPYPIFDFPRPVRVRRMKIPFIVSLCILFFTPVLYAIPYEVLVVAVAEIGNRKKIENFEKTAVKFNALPYKGYFAAKPYFNVLRMANDQVYFVFGFKGEVQGIHRKNYRRTVKNLGRLKNDGAQKYPDMHWVSVEKIRRLLVVP